MSMAYCGFFAFAEASLVARSRDSAVQCPLQDEAQLPAGHSPRQSEAKLLYIDMAKHGCIKFSACLKHICSHRSACQRKGQDELCTGQFLSAWCSQAQEAMPRTCRIQARTANPQGSFRRSTLRAVQQNRGPLRAWG